MYNKAGLKEEGIMFLLTDSQITNERFLIFINDLLASGNIPDLFTGDEVDGIINAVTNKVSNSQIDLKLLSRKYLTGESFRKGS